MIKIFMTEGFGARTAFVHRSRQNQQNRKSSCRFNAHLTQSEYEHILQGVVLSERLKGNALV